MSDFFDKKEEPMDDQPQTIKVGEKEYTQDELNQVVGLGELGREMETKWNTKIDSVLPAYTKATQELSELRKQQNEWLKEKEELNKPKAPIDPIQQSDDDARKLLKDKFKVVTDEDFETKFRSRYMVERQAEKLNDKLTNLKSEIDGSDGRPKFDPQDILNFMSQTNIPDPQIAYKVKYEAQLSDWQARQIQSEKKQGLFTTEVAQALKTPVKTKITKDNLIEALKESMN